MALRPAARDGSVGTLHKLALDDVRCAVLGIAGANFSPKSSVDVLEEREGKGQFRRLRSGVEPTHLSDGETERLLVVLESEAVKTRIVVDVVYEGGRRVS